MHDAAGPVAAHQEVQELKAKDQGQSSCQHAFDLQEERGGGGGGGGGVIRLRVRWVDMVW